MKEHDESVDDPMIDTVYDQDKGIQYEVIDYVKHPKKENYGTFGNAVSDEDREAVQKYFPFTEGAPSWLVALLKDYNNLVDMKELIGHFNTGGENI
jgi:hypothetical protein